MRFSVNCIRIPRCLFNFPRKNRFYPSEKKRAGRRKSPHNRNKHDHINPSSSKEPLGPRSTSNNETDNGLLIQHVARVVYQINCKSTQVMDAQLLSAISECDVVFPRRSESCLSLVFGGELTLLVDLRKVGIWVWRRCS